MRTFLSGARRIERACERGEIIPDMLSDALAWWLYTHPTPRRRGDRPPYRRKATLTEILALTERQGRLEAEQVSGEASAPPRRPGPETPLRSTLLPPPVVASRGTANRS